MVTTRLLLIASALVAATPAVSFAASAKVAVRLAEMRVKPSESAFSRLRLGNGRDIDVIGKSNDGQWLKVRAEINRADELINLEGWVQASEVKGVDLASVSSVDGGSSSDSGWSATPAAAKSESAGWDLDAPAATEPAASSSSDSDWDAPAAETEAAPAAEEKPASDESFSWGEDSSSSSSSSSSSDDGWDTGDSGSSF